MIDEALKSDEYYMLKCIDLAIIAKQRGESPVGSVIVKNGEIIAAGFEAGKAHNDITFHAEIEAIRKATSFLHSQDLSDCIIYTTHEPCIMCSYVIRQTKIKTVVAGIATGEIGGVSSSYPILIDSQIKRWKEHPVVLVGILEAECRKLYD
ncbi:MAG: nucleoside deaminase [Segetibacter sp.]